MNIKKIVKNLEKCPCGREHKAVLQAVEIGRGLVKKTAEILEANGFPFNILVVADENTLRASEGILENLRSGGFEAKLKIYEDLRVADMRVVREIEKLCEDVDGVFSVGSGSLNDICRLAAFRRDKEFAIFATAPSMDGFASDASPITEGNFKASFAARCPKIIIGDTEILAAAPVFLKSAGFGDMVAKYIALADWKIAALTTGEYYCENVAALTREGLFRIVALVDSVTKNSPETAGAIMEALIFTGLGMSFTNNSRPASGAEHVISHYWEIKKLEKGELSDFHGKKVGVATLLTANIYHSLASAEFNITSENPDWDEIYTAYGPAFVEDVKKVNAPTVTVETSTERIKKAQDEIRRIIREELPGPGSIRNLLKRAGAATDISEISVSDELCENSLKYHSYMRHRLTLMRLIPMVSPDFNYSDYIRF